MSSRITSDLLGRSRQSNWYTRQHVPDESNSEANPLRGCQNALPRWRFGLVFSIIRLRRNPCPA